MRYEIGDKVFIIADKEEYLDSKGMDRFNDEGFMDKWLGSIMTVSNVGKKYYRMVEDNNIWFWYEGMIDHERTVLLRQSVSMNEMELGQIYQEILHHYSLKNQVYRISLAAGGQKRILQRRRGVGNWHDVDKNTITLEQYRFVSTYKKPSYGDEYYSIVNLYFHENPIVKFQWTMSPTDSRAYEAGNVFYTKKEAEKTLDDIKNLLLKRKYN